jgi:colanic acid/amylovoran biosynthesis protein
MRLSNQNTAIHTDESSPPRRSRAQAHPVSERPVNICLLGLTFDSPNLGIGALLDGSVRGILHSLPGASISVLDYGVEPFVRFLEFEGRRVPVEFVNLRFSKKVYLANNIAYLIILAFFLRYLAPRPVREYFVGRNRTLRHIARFDVAASIAGGDSFSDIYGLSRLIYESLPQILVLMMGKRLVLLPQTLGPFRTRLARRIAQFILSRADVVCSRDYIGAKQARQFVGEGSAAKIRFCYDLGFLVEPTLPPRLNVGQLLRQKEAGICVVGLNVSGLLYAGGYKRNNMFGLRTNYRELIDEIIRFLIEEKKAAVLLVPHVCPGPKAGRLLESDVHACGQVYNALKSKYEERIFLTEGDYNANEIKYVIRMCDLFVGSRMHSCIAALSQAVPAVAVSYSDKFVGVLQTVGLSGLVADPRRMELQEILAIVRTAFDGKELLRRQLQDTMPGLKKETLELMKDVVLQL